MASSTTRQQSSTASRLFTSSSRYRYSPPPVTMRRSSKLLSTSSPPSSCSPSQSSSSSSSSSKVNMICSLAASSLTLIGCTASSASAASALVGSGGADINSSHLITDSDRAAYSLERPCGGGVAVLTVEKHHQEREKKTKDDKKLRDYERKLKKQKRRRREKKLEAELSAGLKKHSSKLSRPLTEVVRERFLAKLPVDPLRALADQPMGKLLLMNNTIDKFSLDELKGADVSTIPEIFNVEKIAAEVSLKMLVDPSLDVEETVDAVLARNSALQALFSGNVAVVPAERVCGFLHGRLSPGATVLIISQTNSLEKWKAHVAVYTVFNKMPYFIRTAPEISFKTNSYLHIEDMAGGYDPQNEQHIRTLANKIRNFLESEEKGAMLKALSSGGPQPSQMEILMKVLSKPKQQEDGAVITAFRVANPQKYAEFVSGEKDKGANIAELLLMGQTKVPEHLRSLLFPPKQLHSFFPALHDASYFAAKSLAGLGAKDKVAGDAITKRRDKNAILATSHLTSTKTTYPSLVYLQRFEDAKAAESYLEANVPVLAAEKLSPEAAAAQAAAAAAQLPARAA